MATHPSTADVSISNFPAVQPVSGTITTTGSMTIDGQPIDVDVITMPPVTGNVTIGSLPAITGTVGISGQPISTTVSSLPAITGSVTISGQPITVKEDVPAAADILFGSRTTTGTLFTVPANRVWRGSLSLAGAISVAGNATCNVNISGTVIHNLPLSGLALSALASANTLDNVYIHGGAGGQAVTFTAGAAGTTAGSASGRLL